MAPPLRLLAFCAAALFPAAAQPVHPIEHRDLTYLTASGQEQKLDVYQNPSPAPAPVVIYLHGGAWWKGERPKSYGAFRPFLDMGFSVVTVDYRLAGVAPAPAGVQDARCALSWVAAHAAEYRFDSARLVVYGTSAGGHLALMAAMLPASANLDLPECGTVPRPAAVLDFYGIADVHPWLWKEHQSPQAEKWLGPPSGAEAMAARMSPMTYIRPGLPPVLIVHGDADPVVPHSQAEILDAALRKAGVPVKLYTVPGGGHGGFDPEQTREVMLNVAAFLRDQRIVDDPTERSGTVRNR